VGGINYSYRKMDSYMKGSCEEKPVIELNNIKLIIKAGPTEFEIVYFDNLIIQI
jgi:hypothetical protein